MKKQSNSQGNGLSILALFVIGLLMLSRRSHASQSTSNQKSLIKKILTESGYSARMADWIAAVSDHETGTWRSKLYVNAHNMFGMMQPMQRDTLSLGPVKASEGNFASFKNDSDSVKDFVLYLKARQFPSDFDSVDGLVTFMKNKGYFAAPLNIYLSSVKARL